MDNNTAGILSQYLQRRGEIKLLATLADEKQRQDIVQSLYDSSQLNYQIFKRFEEEKIAKFGAVRASNIARIRQHIGTIWYYIKLSLDACLDQPVPDHLYNFNNLLTCYLKQYKMEGLIDYDVSR